MIPEQRAREFVEVGFRNLGVPLEPYIQIIAELIAGAETDLRSEIERLTGLHKAAEAQEWRELQEARAEIERLHGHVTHRDQEIARLDTIVVADHVEIKKLRAALEPFARNVDAVSLSEALGHIERQHLRDARAALEPKP